MSSTARYSDIVFPVVTHFEESFFTGSRVKTDTNVVRKIVEPMYESKPDWEINAMIAERLGIDYGRRGLSDEEVMAIQWKDAKVPDAYKKIDPDFKAPTFEEMLEKANLQLPTPPERASSPRRSSLRANFRPTPAASTSTRLSLASRGRLMQKAARCQYVRPPGRPRRHRRGPQGREVWHTPCSSRRPTCRTARTRASTTTVLMDAFEHRVFMHPDDANARDRRGRHGLRLERRGLHEASGHPHAPSGASVIAVGEEGAWYPAERRF